MRLQSVFLAQGFTTRGGLYDIQGAGLASLTIQTATPPPSFDMCMFILCLSDGGDFGRTVSVNVEVLGPSGERLEHFVNEAVVRGPTAFGAIQVRAPLAGSGRYMYRAWLDDELGSAVAAPLDVAIQPTS